MRILPTIKTVIRPAKRNGKSSITLRFTYKRKSNYITIGAEIEPEKFKDGKVVGSSQMAREINNLILLFETRAFKVLGEMSEGDQITFEKFKSKFDKKYNVPFHQFIMKTALEWSKTRGHSKSTTNLYKYVSRKLKSFDDNLLLSDVDRDKIKEFELFLYECIKSVKSNNNNSVCHVIYITSIFYNHAVGIGLVGDKKPFVDAGKNKSRPKKAASLTLDEIDAILQYISSGKACDKTEYSLKALVFCCATGLRISDAKRVGAENIHRTRNGMYLTVKTQKSKKNITTPVLFFAENLVNNLLTGEDEFFFAKFKRQHDEAMKSGVLAAGVDKDVSTHTGRVTFATLSYKAGVREQTLCDAMGHSNLSTTMNYRSSDIFAPNEFFRCFNKPLDLSVDARVGASQFLLFLKRQRNAPEWLEKITAPEDINLPMLHEILKTCGLEMELLGKMKMGTRHASESTR